MTQLYPLSLYSILEKRKNIFFAKNISALERRGYLILTDYFVETDELERFYRQELLRLKSEQGVDDDGFYHYDTPLTREHELQALKERGGASIGILAERGAAAAIKAVK